MDLGLEGKAALVTGASRGLGEAIAHELANQGVQVCLAARDETKLAEVAAAITARTQAHCVSFAGDLRQAERSTRRYRLPSLRSAGSISW